MEIILKNIINEFEIPCYTKLLLLLKPAAQAQQKKSC